MRTSEKYTKIHYISFVLKSILLILSNNISSKRPAMSSDQERDYSDTETSSQDGDYCDAEPIPEEPEENPDQDLDNVIEEREDALVELHVEDEDLAGQIEEHNNIADQMEEIVNDVRARIDDPDEPYEYDDDDDDDDDSGNE